MVVVLCIDLEGESADSEERGAETTKMITVWL